MPGFGRRRTSDRACSRGVGLRPVHGLLARFVRFARGEPGRTGPGTGNARSQPASGPGTVPDCPRPQPRAVARRTARHPEAAASRALRRAARAGPLRPTSRPTRVGPSSIGQGDQPQCALLPRERLYRVPRAGEVAGGATPNSRTLERGRPASFVRSGAPLKPLERLRAGPSPLRTRPDRAPRGAACRSRAESGARPRIRHDGSSSGPLHERTARQCLAGVSESVPAPHPALENVGMNR